MITSLLESLLVLLAAAVAVTVIFRRLHIPSVIGYILVGVVLGPHLTGVIADSHDVMALAEFGVVFLLFTIGLEFSLSKLIAMRKTVLGFGGLQVVLCIAVPAFVGHWLGLSATAAVVAGGLVAMSSTAIVMKQLGQRFELHTPYGRAAVGILLMQDLAVIPLLIFISSMSAINGHGLGYDLVMALLKGALAIVVIVQVGRRVLRPLFYRIAEIRSTELFTLATLLVALGCAWMTHQLGLSLALGAFLAGMTLGETEFRHQIMVEIRPFRDVLLGLFFITIGMQINIYSIPATWEWIVGVLFALLFFKTAVISAVGLLFGYSRADALRTGLILAQGGEFGFALLITAVQHSLLSSAYAEVMLTALLLSMLLAPLLIRFHHVLADGVFPHDADGPAAAGKEALTALSSGLQNHAIICGFGRVGQNLAELLKQENLPYLALDLDIDRVDAARLSGSTVVYADATHPDILMLANIASARVVCVCIDHRMHVLKIVEQARRLNASLPILVRSYDDADFELLYQKGVTHVVSEAMEFSLALGSHLLLLLGLSSDKMTKRIERSRWNHYQQLRAIFPGHSVFEPEELALGRAQLHVLAVPEGAYAVGKSLRALELDRAGVQVVSLRRQNQSRANPRPNTKVQAEDVLVFFAHSESFSHARQLILEGE